MRQFRVSLLLLVLVAAVGTAAASTVLGLSVEDQARLSTLVVAGHVTTLRGEDDPANGIETAVGLVVTDVFKGDVRPGETVVFHTRGGEVDGVISLAEGEAEFRHGQRVLVFIEEIDGRLYNLGLSSGVWTVAESRREGLVFARALTNGLEVAGGVDLETGPISLGEMSARVQSSTRRPDFDHPVLRESRLGRR